MNFIHDSSDVFKMHFIQRSASATYETRTQCLIFNLRHQASHAMTGTKVGEQKKDFYWLHTKNTLLNVGKVYGKR
jgi:hypothetical protein